MEGKRPAQLKQAPDRFWVEQVLHGSDLNKDVYETWEGISKEYRRIMGKKASLQCSPYVGK
jgi:hypothetical protein